MRDLNLTTGTVITALPYLNSYLVDVKGVGRVLSVSGEEGSADRRGSTGGPTGYLPGTEVLLACPSRTNPDSLSQIIPHVIICAFSIFTKIPSTEFIPTPGVDNPSDYNQSEVPNILIDSNFEKILRQDRSYNALLDSLPGDWQKSNVSGALLRVSQFLAQIGVGDDCMLTFNGVDRSARMTFDNLVKEAVTFSEIVNAADDAPMSVKQFAATAQEGLGSLTGGDPLTEDDDGLLVTVDENQKSYFRHVIMEGGGSEGFMQFNQVNTSSEEINTFKNTEMAGVTSSMNRGDGIYRIKAAKEVSMRKTGCIQVPVQTSELLQPIDLDTLPAVDPYEGLTDDEAKMQAFSLDDYSQYVQAFPLLYSEFEDFEDHNLTLNKLKDKQEWTYPKPDQKGTKIADPSGTSLPPLGEKDSEYNVEQLTSLIQEAIELLPGRRIKLWKNESAFVMFEDGSLIIEDGFGAGISMGKGSLTLASAGDIKFLPGRDIIGMAPGKCVLKAKDRIDISSSEKAISLKAEENLQVVSGNGGSGSLILENRGAGNMSEVTERQAQLGEATGGGIYLKSQAGMAVLSSSIYMGAQSSRADSEAGLDREANNCNITIDSGSGMLHLAGARGSVLMDSSLEIGHRQSSSGIYFNGNQTILTTDALGIVAPLLNIGKGSGSMNRTQVTKQGVKYTKHNLPSSEPNVILHGNLKASGNIGSVGSIQTEAGVKTNEGAEYLPKPRSKYGSINMPTENPGTVSNIVSSYAPFLRTSLNTQVRLGLLTEKAHAYAELVYPTSDAMGINPENTYFDEAKWQRLLASPGNWDEPAITSAILGKSYPYPGTQVYEEDSAIIRGVESSGKVVKKKFSEYKTNT